MNSFSNSDQNDFDRLAASNARISNGINNIHGDLSETNSLIKSGFNSQAGILSSVRNGITSVGRGISNVYNNNKEQYGVNTQEFGRRFAAMAGGPIGVAIKDVLSNSGINVGSIVKKSIGGVANLFHGHNNKLDNDINELEDINSKQLSTGNQQLIEARKANKLLNNISKQLDGDTNTNTTTLNNRARQLKNKITNKDELYDSTGRKLNSTQLSNAILKSAHNSETGASSSPSEIVNLLQQILESQQNLGNYFQDPNASKEGGVFGTLVKDIISMPFGFKYWFGGRYSKDIQRSNNPLETIVNALLKSYEWQRIGIDLSRRQLNELIRLQGGQPQKYVGHEGAAITAVKRLGNAIKEGATKTLGNNALGRGVGSLLSLPMSFMRFGDEDFKDQQYLQAYRVFSGMGKSREKGLKGFWQNITGGDKELEKVLYSERNTRRAIDTIMGADADNRTIGKRTKDFVKTVNNEDENKVRDILNDKDIKEYIDALNYVRNHTDEYDDERLKLFLKDFKRLSASKISEYGIDGIHGSRLNLNNDLFNFQNLEQLKANDKFSIDQVFSGYDRKKERRDNLEKYIQEQQEILNNPNLTHSEKLTAAQNIRNARNSADFEDGGVTQQEVSFNSKNGQHGRIGEAGPEAIVPLQGDVLELVGSKIADAILHATSKGTSSTQRTSSSIVPVVVINPNKKIVSSLRRTVGGGFLPKETFDDIYKKALGIDTKLSVADQISDSLIKNKVFDNVGSSIKDKFKGTRAQDGTETLEEKAQEAQVGIDKTLSEYLPDIAKLYKSEAKKAKEEKENGGLSTLGGLLSGIGKIGGGLISGIASIGSGLLSAGIGLAKFGLGLTGFAASIYGIVKSISAAKEFLDKHFPGAISENPANLTATAGAIDNVARQIVKGPEEVARTTTEKIKSLETDIKTTENIENTARKIEAERKINLTKTELEKAKQLHADEISKSETRIKDLSRFDDIAPEDYLTESELKEYSQETVKLEKLKAERSARISELESDINNSIKIRDEAASKITDNGEAYSKLNDLDKAKVRDLTNIRDLRTKVIKQTTAEINSYESIIKSIESDPTSAEFGDLEYYKETLKNAIERKGYYEKMNKPLTEESAKKLAEQLKANAEAQKLLNNKWYGRISKGFERVGKYGYGIQVASGLAEGIMHAYQGRYQRAGMDVAFNLQKNPGLALAYALVSASADSKTHEQRELFGELYNPYVADDEAFNGALAFSNVGDDIFKSLMAGYQALWGSAGRTVALETLKGTKTYETYDALRNITSEARSATKIPLKSTSMVDKIKGGKLLPLLSAGIEGYNAYRDFNNGDFIGASISLGAMTTMAWSAFATGPVGVIVGTAGLLLCGAKWGWDKYKQGKATKLYYENQGAFTDLSFLCNKKYHENLVAFSKNNSDILKIAENQVKEYHNYLKEFKIPQYDKYYHGMMKDREFLFLCKDIYFDLSAEVKQAKRIIDKEDFLYNIDKETTEKLKDVAERKIFSKLYPLYITFLKDIVDQNAISEYKDKNGNIISDRVKDLSQYNGDNEYIKSESSEIKYHLSNQNENNGKNISAAYLSRQYNNEKSEMDKYDSIKFPWQDYEWKSVYRYEIYDELFRHYEDSFDTYNYFKEDASINPDFVIIINRIISDTKFASDFIPALTEAYKYAAGYKISHYFGKGDSNETAAVKKVNEICAKYNVPLSRTLYNNDCKDLWELIYNYKDKISEYSKKLEYLTTRKQNIDTEFGATKERDIGLEKVKSQQKQIDNSEFAHNIDSIIQNHPVDESIIFTDKWKSKIKKAYGDTDNKNNVFEDSDYIAGFLDDGTPLFISKNDNILLTKRIRGFTKSGIPYEIAEKGPELISNGNIIPVGDNFEAKIAQDRLNRIQDDLNNNYIHLAGGMIGPTIEAAEELKKQNNSLYTPKPLYDIKDILEDISKEQLKQDKNENKNIVDDSNYKQYIKDILGKGNETLDSLKGVTKKGFDKAGEYYKDVKKFISESDILGSLTSGFEKATEYFKDLANNFFEDEEFKSQQVNKVDAEISALKEDSNEYKQFLADVGVSSLDEFKALDVNEKYEKLKKSKSYGSKINKELERKWSDLTVDPDLTAESANIRAAKDVLSEEKGNIAKSITADQLGDLKDKKFEDLSDEEKIFEKFKKTEQYNKAETKPTKYSEINTEDLVAAFGLNDKKNQKVNEMMDAANRNKAYAVSKKEGTFDAAVREKLEGFKKDNVRYSEEQLAGDFSEEGRQSAYMRTEEKIYAAQRKAAEKAQREKEKKEAETNHEIAINGGFSEGKGMPENIEELENATVADKASNIEIPESNTPQITPEQAAEQERKRLDEMALIEKVYAGQMNPTEQSTPVQAANEVVKESNDKATNKAADNLRIWSKMDFEDDEFKKDLAFAELNGIKLGSYNRNLFGVQETTLSDDGKMTFTDKLNGFQTKNLNDLRKRRLEYEKENDIKKSSSQYNLEAKQYSYDNIRNKLAQKLKDNNASYDLWKANSLAKISALIEKRNAEITDHNNTFKLSQEELVKATPEEIFNRLGEFGYNPLGISTELSSIEWQKRDKKRYSDNVDDLLGIDKSSEMDTWKVFGMGSVSDFKEAKRKLDNANLNHNRESNLSDPVLLTKYMEDHNINNIYDLMQNESIPQRIKAEYQKSFEAVLKKRQEDETLSSMAMEENALKEAAQMNPVETTSEKAKEITKESNVQTPVQTEQSTPVQAANDVVKSNEANDFKSEFIKKYPWIDRDELNDEAIKEYSTRLAKEPWLATVDFVNDADEEMDAVDQWDMMKKDYELRQASGQKTGKVEGTFVGGQLSEVKPENHFADGGVLSSIFNTSILSNVDEVGRKIIVDHVKNIGLDKFKQNNAYIGDFLEKYPIKNIPKNVTLYGDTLIAADTDIEELLRGKKFTKQERENIYKQHYNAYNLELKEAELSRKFANGGYEGFSDKPILESLNGKQVLSSEAGMEAKINLDQMSDGGAAFIPMNDQHTTMLNGLQKYIAQGIQNNGVVPGDKSYKSGTTYSTDSNSESMKRKLANDLLAGARGEYADGGFFNWIGDKIKGAGKHVLNRVTDKGMEYLTSKTSELTDQLIPLIAKTLSKLDPFIDESLLFMNNVNDIAEHINTITSNVSNISMNDVINTIEQHPEIISVIENLVDSHKAKISNITSTNYQLDAEAGKLGTEQIVDGLKENANQIVSSNNTAVYRIAKAGNTSSTVNNITYNDADRYYRMAEGSPAQIRA